LADAGVERLVVADVMAERASELAEQMARQHPGTRAEVVAADRAAARVATASGVVNASPVGMEGFPGLPFDVLVLRPEHWVADIVYRPVRTALLAAAAWLPDLGRCADARRTGGRHPPPAHTHRPRP
jgi:shikimate dehydrogenase